MDFRQNNLKFKELQPVTWHQKQMTVSFWVIRFLGVFLLLVLHAIISLQTVCKSVWLVLFQPAQVSVGLRFVLQMITYYISVERKQFPRKTNSEE